MSEFAQGFEEPLDRQAQVPYGECSDTVPLSDLELSFSSDTYSENQGGETGPATAYLRSIDDAPDNPMNTGEEGIVIEPDHMPTATDGQRAAEWLNQISGDMPIDHPGAVGQHISSLEADARLAIISQINGMARGLPEGMRDMDGEGRILRVTPLWATEIDYDPPAKEDRRDLLVRAIEASITLPPERGATLMGLAINAIHPYADGNGRTSRFLYMALSHGYDARSPEDWATYGSLFVNTEGREVVDLNQTKFDLPAKYSKRLSENIARRFGYEGPRPTYSFGGYSSDIIDEQTPGTILTQQGIPQIERQYLFDVVNDENLGHTALTQYILESGKDPADYIRSWDNGERTAVELDVLVPQLTSNDIHIIKDVHSSMKRGYVRDIIDTFTNPDRDNEAQAIVDFYRPG